MLAKPRPSYEIDTLGGGSVECLEPPYLIGSVQDYIDAFIQVTPSTHMPSDETLERVAREKRDSDIVAYERDFGRTALAHKHGILSADF